MAKTMVIPRYVLTIMVSGFDCPLNQPHQRAQEQPPPIETLPSGNQTWRAGKWTIEIGDFPIKTSIHS